jgi:hypothetical protein
MTGGTGCSSKWRHPASWRFLFNKEVGRAHDNANTINTKGVFWSLA